jgi:aspartokinase-like uncharacterized kinase
LKFKLGVQVVLKLGGSLLGAPERLAAVLAAVEEASRTRRILIVPGGGPFADAVREVDRRLGLSDEAAHWMAVLAMDQYGHLLASRLANGVLVAGPEAAGAALEAGRLPVLAPSAWLRQVDPLPHSWDVTSDSIAAWVAGAVGARRLVLVKPPGASREAVDASFASTLPDGVLAVVLPADQVARLLVVLG